MMDDKALIPEVPNDRSLPTLFPERLDWAALAEDVAGVTGKDLFEMNSLGEQEANKLAAQDALIKNYLPKFKEWFSNRFDWFLDIAKNIDAVRLNEERLCREERSTRLRILGEYKLLIDRAQEAERRRREEEQRQRDLEERRKQLAEIRSRQTAEAEAEAKQLEAEPIIPVAITKQQVMATSAIPKAPEKLSGRKVYDREIENWGAFLGWVALNQAWVGQLFTRQSDGTYRLSFAKLKSSAQPMPGVKITERIETSNRA
jgi:hypothetical protein